jgi:hypothetical protein
LWNDTTGTYDFQNVIVDTFHLPYLSSSSASGLKFDPEDKSTINVDQSYFQSNPEVIFEYKSDAKKD